MLSISYVLRWKEQRTLLLVVFAGPPYLLEEAEIMESEPCWNFWFYWFFLCLMFAGVETDNSSGYSLHWSIKLDVLQPFQEKDFLYVSPTNWDILR